ncbi:4-aminobutyrate aminotransferase [Gaiella occulta]|uniref:4-aminobutyrate aminotransferase n=2 Tax=Gaiella occulta TaxID=1002870 RepID=A0A7M2YVZ6_9ACTN|nr:4-aminobutyrate aminotransferase [Gaiella occulta]
MSKMEVQTPASAETDWDQVREWDEQYVFHVLATKDEYRSNVVESADGCYVTMADGRRIFDFANQLICVNMGHRHPKIVEAIREATDKFGYVWEGLTTEYRARAAKLIMEDIGVGEWAGRIRFLSTGTEAVENMVLFAKLYTGRRNIVTRTYDYHGWTNALSGANGMRGYRSSLASGSGEPVHLDVPDAPSANYHYAPAPHCYRCPIGHSYPNCKDENGTLACVKATEHLISSIGPETVAGFITEPAQGAGMIHPPKEYFPQVREMTKRLNVLWLDDEVMTGFGRLGEWFGYKVYDVTPDIMAVAKGLSSSSLPAAGVVLSKEVTEFFDQWRFNTMSTFGSHPLGMAAVCGNLEAMLEENILERVRDLGGHLGSGLMDLQERHPCVGLASGRGLMWSLELVRNKETHEPFVSVDRYSTYAKTEEVPASAVVGKIAYDEGVAIGAFLPNSIRLATAFVATKSDIDFGLAALDKGLSELDKYCD